MKIKKKKKKVVVVENYNEDYDPYFNDPTHWMTKEVTGYVDSNGGYILAEDVRLEEPDYDSLLDSLDEE